jgi:glucose-6-phosphate isomerase
MLEAKAVYEASGLNFGEHCVAITRVGSLLHEVALKDKWLTSFPMWDWVGGRTSELSAVGLVPAALQGIDIQLILSGAKACDELTRRTDVLTNPSAQLALAWYFSGDGRGLKDMVVIPYKDRLELLPRYLQQLVMESLGKEMDRDGTIVNQGLNVFGNKGSTDQHSYIQQLRDGINNFFVTFLEVLSDGESSNLEVDENLTSSDYLAGFYLGTRQALFENGRDSLTVIVQEISPSTIGALIALFERAVGFYATLANVNAYHQPGVEAGKKAAESILGLQKKIFDLLSEAQGEAMACTDIANRIGNPDEVEHVFKICERLSTNQKTGVTKTAALNPFGTKFKIY